MSDTYNHGEDVEKATYLALCNARQKGIILDFDDNTNSFSLPDFKIRFDAESLNGFDKLPRHDQAIIRELVSRGAYIDVKYKGYYNLNSWPGFAELGVINSKDAFIEDDLTIRKLEILGGFFGFLVLATQDGKIYSFQTALLNRSYRVKLVNRPQQGLFYKGKWLLPVGIGVKLNSIEELILGIKASFVSGSGFCGVLDSVSAPTEIESISETAGEVRTQEYKDKDLGSKSK